MTNHITNATDGPEKTLHLDKFIKFTYKLGTIELTDHHYQSRVHDCQFSLQTQNIDNLLLVAAMNLTGDFYKWGGSSNGNIPRPPFPPWLVFLS